MLRTVVETETFREGVNLNTVKAIAQFEAADRIEVVAGIVLGKSQNYPDGTSIDMVAKTQHGGNDKIPSRPWMAIAFQQNLPIMQRQMENVIDNVLAGRTTIDRGLARVGQQVVSQQRQALAALDTPPLSPVTIKKKAADRASGRKSKPPLGYGVDKPLVETQHLFNEHVWLVRGRTL